MITDDDIFAKVYWLLGYTDNRQIANFEDIVSDPLLKIFAFTIAGVVEDCAFRIHKDIDNWASWCCGM
jgi:hypothetical protein